MWRIVLAVVAGCGRIHFDPTSNPDATGDSGGSGCVAAPEVCNGIDDNCDGRVDEGCPCTPFTTMFENVVTPTMISTGLDWWILTTDPFLIHIDGTTGATLETIDVPAGIVVTNEGQQLAWDGSRFIGMLGDQLVWFDTTGAITKTGPLLGIAPGNAILAWTGTSIDVAGVPATSDRIDYVRANLDGVGTSPIATAASPVTTTPTAIGVRAGVPFVMWSVDTGYAEIGEPAGTEIPSTMFGLDVGHGAASDGTRTLAAANKLYVVDDNGVMQLTLGGTSVAWTGDGWDFASNDITSPAAHARLAHLDEQLTSTMPVVVMTVVDTVSIDALPPRISSDARRTLVQWNVGADGNAPIGHLAQVCH